MVETRLSEKAVQTAVEAVRRYDDYKKRADYIQDRFTNEEAGYWGCFIKHADDKAAVGFYYNVGIRINVRVGDSDIKLWKNA